MRRGRLAAILQRSARGAFGIFLAVAAPISTRSLRTLPQIDVLGTNASPEIED